MRKQTGPKCCDLVQFMRQRKLIEQPEPYNNKMFSLEQLQKKKREREMSKSDSKTIEIGIYSKPRAEDDLSEG